MRIPLVPFLIFFLICILIDAYIYVSAIKRGNRKAGRLLLYTSLFIYLFLIFLTILPYRSGNETVLSFVNWGLFTVITVYLPKIIYVVFDLFSFVPEIWRGRRFKPFSAVGCVLAVIAFGAMWWGAIINRFNLRIVEISVDIPDLPYSFVGYKIVQISDLHVGTYGSDSSFLDELVAKVNGRKPDLVVFTGDIVNRRTYELDPHCSSLARIDAPDGVIAILGNHDYGDYSTWPDEDAKTANMKALYRHFDNMGWRLLLNDHEFIHRRGDSIAVIGVENIGDPPFTVYGSLRDSYPTLNDSVTKILLSHNPMHWADEIADNDSINIALTLSGHTHAMQIEIAGVSPSSLRYKYWGGLYTDSRGRSPLYVNIGIGTVGLPMRIGATPEITLITLRR